MLISNFKDLIVWRKAHELVLAIYKATQCYPNQETFGLVTQIRRSAVSVCANIAEGQKKKTLDYARFVQMAQASLEETKYHLLLSRDLNYLDGETYQEMMGEAEDISKMLHGLRRNLTKS